jgi:hypothetical protein
VRSTDGGTIQRAAPGQRSVNREMALVRHSLGRAERSNRCRLVRYVTLEQRHFAALLFLQHRWRNTWSPNVAVNPFNPFIGYPNQSKIGDYITIVSDDAGANVAYAATFNGEEDIYYVRIRPAASLGNVSTRAFVQTGENVMIGGFIVKLWAKESDHRAIGPGSRSMGSPMRWKQSRLDCTTGPGIDCSNDDWRPR